MLGLPRALAIGVLLVLSVAAAVLAQNVGAILKNPDGSNMTVLTASQSALAAIGAAMPSNSLAIAGKGSTTTGGLMTDFIICDQQIKLKMTSATTTEIIPLSSGKTIHICHIRVVANGATTFTFKKGTGTNCGTGTTAIDNAIELDAQDGYVAGIGIGEVLSGESASNAVCVTNSAAENLSIFLRYAQF